MLCVGHGAKKTWDESSEATGFSVTSEYNGRKNGLVEYGSVGEESNQVTFFVLKIVFGERDRDRVFVYRDPPSLWDESACDYTSCFQRCHSNDHFDHQEVKQEGTEEGHTDQKAEIQENETNPEQKSQVGSPSSVLWHISDWGVVLNSASFFEII